jgi:hypothetical protein
MNNDDEESSGTSHAIDSDSSGDEQTSTSAVTKRSRDGRRSAGKRRASAALPGLETVIVGMKFTKTPNDDNSRPLSECIAWALKHSSEAFPMLVYVQLSLDVRGRQFVRRDFWALDINEFLYRGGSDQYRHYDEVIVADAPCKAYCDFECEFTDEWARKRQFANLAALLQHCGVATVNELRLALDKSARRLIDEIVAHHHSSGATDRPVESFETVSHKQTKWSMHVVFVNSLWAHAGHVGAFIERVVRESDDPLVRLYVDTQVYGNNRCLRMYRSTKPDEPERSLLRAHDKVTDRIDRNALRDSLVTAIRIGDSDSGSRQYVTSAYLRSRGGEAALAELGLPAPLTDSEYRERAPSRVQSVRAAGCVDDGVVGEATAAAIRASFPQYTVRKFLSNVDSGLITVDLCERRCAIANRDHKTPRSFIVIDMLARQWRHGCFSRDCKVQRCQWSALPTSMTAACDEYRRPLAECFASLRPNGTNGDCQ